MKTAAIILICIGLFVFIKDSQAANPDDVFNTLATEKDTNGKPIIPEKGLEKYLVKNGWGRPEGLSAKGAEAAILEWDNQGNKFISKGKWDAMIRTATWLLSLETNPALVWFQLRIINQYGEEISPKVLAEYMDKNNWNAYSQDMTAEVAANHIARGGSYIIKNEWNATIEIEAFICIAQ